MQVIEHVEIHNGEGLIRGRKLKAKMVARMHLWEGKSIEEVAAHYDLSAAEVHAALAFYYDNQTELDAEYEENMQLLKQVGTSSEEFRARIEARKQNEQD